MTLSKHSATMRILALILVAILIIPHTALSAHAVEPRASLYLNSYITYICAMGDGDLQIWFRVVGTREWADLGVLMIQLYESSDQTNWTRVDTLQHTEYEQMLGHDTGFTMDYVPYDGTPGMYYKGYVCIWGGDGTNGDSRYFWTDVVQCT